jgi:hypothetical protein
MRKRAGWLGWAVAVAIVGGLVLGGLASESAAQGDMKKDDKPKTGDTMKSGDTKSEGMRSGDMKSGDAMQSGDRMKSGEATMKGDKKGERKDDKMLQGDRTMEKT